VSGSGVGRGKDGETRQTNLVADGAVVFHGVLHAAVLLVAQCGRVARTCVKMDGSTRIKSEHARARSFLGDELSCWEMRKGLLTALAAVEEVLFSSDSVAIQRATIVRSRSRPCTYTVRGKEETHLQMPQSLQW
jgi:hypothetical protein